MAQPAEQGSEAEDAVDVEHQRRIDGVAHQRRRPFQRAVPRAAVVVDLVRAGATPTAALVTALFVGWRWGAKKALAEMNGLPFAALWSVLIRVVCPLATAGVMIYILATGNFF